VKIEDIFVVSDKPNGANSRESLEKLLHEFSWEMEPECEE
jgi:hypothetical protein